MLSNTTFFISSTFRDFQAERDLLHLKIIPALDQQARENGCGVNMVDLRWGVNTSELDISEKSNRVLSVCLDEIDDCAPYFLLFLGDRYGWIPEQGTISSVLEQRGIHSACSDWSVTALEAYYGLLMNAAASDTCLICMRDSLDPSLLGEATADYCSSSPTEQQLLQQLKEELIRRFPEKVIRYTARWDSERNIPVMSEDFHEQLQHRLSEILCPQWAWRSKLNRYQREQHRLWAELQGASPLTPSRETSAAQLLAQLEKTPIGIYGPAGSDKTAVLGECALKLRQNAPVCFLSCGASADTDTVEAVLDHMIAFTEELLGISDHFSETADGSKDLFEIRRDQLKTLLSQVEGKVFFFLDNVDRLAPSRERDTYRFLPTDHANAVFVLSAESKSQQAHVSYQAALCPPQDTDLTMHILQKLKEHHKLVDTSVLCAILDRCRGQSLFYTNLVLKRLVLVDSQDLHGCSTDRQINDRLCEIIGALSDDETDLFDQMRQLVEERIAPEQTPRVFRLLAASQQGLRERDLEELFRRQGWPWQAVDFAALTRYGSFLLSRSGDGFYRLYRHSAAAAEDRCRLRDYLAACDDDEVLVREGFPCAWQLQDLPFAAALITHFARKDKAPWLFRSVLATDSGVWLLKAAARSEVSVDACRWLSEVFYHCALYHTKQELTHPLYNFIGVQCLRIANQKQESVELLDAIIAGCGKNYMSLGAHWMNDMPDWLPQFYLLSHQCVHRKYELGALDENRFLENAATCYVTAYLTVSYFKNISIWDEVSFMELEELKKPAYYLTWAAYYLRKLFCKGIYCKVFKYDIDETPDLLSLAQRAQDGEDHFVLGTGRFYDTSLHEFLNEHYIGKDLRLRFISYLESTDPDANLTDFLK